ncbi:MAG: hypothetical protein PHR66_12020 [Desulfuromonadaceae bacterium]|nr:hypothetical protein [Desulfuromonadaceae bacterium]
MATHYGNHMDEKLKKLLSHILVGRDGISEQKFERALTDRDVAWSLMREILAQKGDRLTCGVTAARTTLMPDAIKLASGVRQPLGRLLLECGKITREQLKQGLEVQQQTGEQIGGVLVRLGALDNSVLEDTLQSQMQQQKEKQSTPTPVAIRIGDILVAGGHISREQLNESIEHQKNSNKKLGEILVEKGYVQQHQVEHGIHLQQMLVAAALSAVVSISSLDREAEAGSSGNTSSATVHVSATVRPIAIAKVLYQQQQMEITGKDIAQGYVEIPNGSRIEVRSNNPSGYLLSIENQGGPFRDVYVSGLGSEVQLNGGTGWVLMSYTQMPRTMDVSYRIMLSDDAKPGSYPWPFQVSAVLI